MTRRSVLVARRTFLLRRQQLEDLHRALPVAAGQEREAVGERLRRSEIVGLDDRVADEIASWSFSAVVANGGSRPERAAAVDKGRADLCHPLGALLRCQVGHRSSRATVEVDELRHVDHPFREPLAPAGSWCTYS